MFEESPGFALNTLGGNQEVLERRRANHFGVSAAHEFIQKLAVPFKC
jgi:hypothetical protein